MHSQKVCGLSGRKPSISLLCLRFRQTLARTFTSRIAVKLNGDCGSILDCRQLVRCPGWVSNCILTELAPPHGPRMYVMSGIAGKPHPDYISAIAYTQGILDADPFVAFTRPQDVCGLLG